MTALSPSWLEREARAQAEVLAARTTPGWEQAEAAARCLERGDVDYLVIAARGTSDNAARYAQYLLGSEARLLTALAAPWLYVIDSAPRLDRGAVLAISQSGRSPDVAAVLAAASAQGRPSILITNDASSPMSELADVTVPLLAGPERSVPATKTYLASLHAVAQITACLDGASIDVAWFPRVPELVSGVTEDQFTGRARFDALAGTRLLTVIGRGLGLPTAHETALKVREVSGMPAEAFSLPDLIHGPIAALHPTGALWVVSTAGREQPDPAAFDALRGDVGVTVAVSDRDELIEAADIGIRMPAGLPEWLAPMLAVLPGQAAALRLGEIAGVDVDHPHGLSKVTLTR